MLTFENVLQLRVFCNYSVSLGSAFGIRMQATWFNDNQMTMFDRRRLAFGFV